MSQKLVNNSQIVIFDIEGSDSADRGDNMDHCEKTLALLALVMADVLIINTETSSIGRRNASNLALLEVIFQVNTRIVGESTPN